MIKNILNTVFVRVFNAVITLIIVIINSNTVGSEGMGVISLIILSVSIFVLLSGFISGALIYFVPRENAFHLFLISYGWTILAAIFFYVFMLLVPIVPEKYIIHAFLLSLIFAFSSIHEKILIGKEKIITVNYISFIKIVLLIITLLVLYYTFSLKNVNSYVGALFVSYSAGYTLTLSAVFKFLKPEKLHNIKALFIKVFRLSGYNAAANIIQKLNYRLSYYLIEYFLGIKALGVFSVGVQVSESVLIIGRSISVVQYSKISNINDNKKSVFITVSLVKVIFIISSVLIIFFSLLPDPFYKFIFSKDFENLNYIIMSLGLGIIALSCTTVISPFFAGTGNHLLNAKSAFVGFVVTIAGGLILIPELKIIGAGITATLSYITSLIYQIYLFKKLNHFKLTGFLFKKEDFRMGFDLLKSLFRKGDNSRTSQT